MDVWDLQNRTLLISDANDNVSLILPRNSVVVIAVIPHGTALQIKSNLIYADSAELGLGVKGECK